MNLRKIVNRSFIALSISLSGYFLYFLSDNPIISIICVVVAIMYELGNKFVLVEAIKHYKENRKSYARFLFFIYSLYIIYNILSGAGFFINEIAVQDQAVVQTELDISFHKSQLHQIEKRIETLNHALEVEIETGFGSNSKRITEELKLLEDKQRESQDKILSKPVGEMQRKNPFRGLAHALRVSVNFLMVSVWVMVMTGICTIIIITTEGFYEDLTGKQGAVTKTLSVTPRNTSKKTVTLQETDKGVTTERLCICGCGKPVKGKSMYHSGACRTRMSRNKKNNKGEEKENVQAK